MTRLLAHIAFSLLLISAGVAMGQTQDSIHAGGNDPDLPQPKSKAEALSGGPQLSSRDSEAVKARKYTTPDLPPKWARVPEYNGEYFTTLLGFAGIYDYNAFSQDSDSISQVGHQRDQWDNRSTRFILTGASGPSHTGCIT